MNILPLAVDLDAGVADAVVALLVLAAEGQAGTVGAIAGGAPDDLLLQVDRLQVIRFRLLGGGKVQTSYQRQDNGQEKEAPETHNTSSRLSAPTGRNMKAQGNALGNTEFQ